MAGEEIIIDDTGGASVVRIRDAKNKFDLTGMGTMGATAELSTVEFRLRVARKGDLIEKALVDIHSSLVTGFVVKTTKPDTIAGKWSKSGKLTLTASKPMAQATEKYEYKFDSHSPVSEISIDLTKGKVVLPGEFWLQVNS